MPQSASPDLAAMRHTAAHVLAAVSTRLKPETRLGVGPAIDHGFYHDIDVDERYTDKDLAILQKEMMKIKKRNLSMKQRDISKEEARKIFAHDPFKLELIDDIPGETVGISDMGDGFFVTLCKGGHVASTGKIGFFQLTHLASAYWKGDSSKPQLQRIYGALFATQEELDTYLQQQEEAKRRDHRRLGKELDLFTFSPLVGSGLPLFTPRGTIIRQELEKFVQSLQEPAGYQRVFIPHLAKADLYKTSGHWEKFSHDLFHVKGHGDEQFVLKPMNCPHHTQIYAARPRSYRDLPLRFSEVTTCYRDEQMGELQGLSRVRSLTQDDAHVFCRPDQIHEEIERIYTIINQFYETFGLPLAARLSLHDPAQAEKYLGDAQLWEQAEDTLRQILIKKKATFTEAVGEAAFYGPKIDFIAHDSLGRKWQLATIQLDFNMPTQFGLSYSDADGTSKSPTMIHRAILGSLERFIAILLEHYAGVLPLWLSPVQVAVLSISDAQAEYARNIQEDLTMSGIRAQLDERSESIGKKIREAELQKIPVMVILGKKEVSAQMVAVRSRQSGDQGQMPIEKLKQQLTEAMAQRKNF